MRVRVFGVVKKFYKKLRFEVVKQTHRWHTGRSGDRGPLLNKEAFIRIVMENLTSQAVTRIEFVSGDTDAYDIENGKLYYTKGTLSVTFISGKTYAYDGVDFDEFTELMTSISIGRNLNDNIKPFKNCRQVAVPAVNIRYLDFGGHVWERQDA